MFLKRIIFYINNNYLYKVRHRDILFLQYQSNDDH